MVAAKAMQIKGTVEKGVGQGSFFTSLDWVADQFKEAMGCRPFPGTLNIRANPQDAVRLKGFLKDCDFEITPPDQGFCAARLKKVWIGGLAAAAVLPAREVRIHGEAIVEIMCGVNIKRALRLKDGDEVIVSDVEI
jgi:riboflavin kinase